LVAGSGSAASTEIKDRDERLIKTNQDAYDPRSSVEYVDSAPKTIGAARRNVDSKLSRTQYMGRQES